MKHNDGHVNLGTSHDTGEFACDSIERRWEGQGRDLEDVQYLAGHADPRTTRIYDRRRRKVTRTIVERISI